MVSALSGLIRVSNRGDQPSESTFGGPAQSLPGSSDSGIGGPDSISELSRIHVSPCDSPSPADFPDARKIAELTFRR